MPTLDSIMGALLIAKGLGGKVAVLDTERGSASLYADVLPFDVVELGPPYSPERFVEVIHAAEKAGYDTLVIDSITHEWKGSGGMLEIVDTISKARFKGNSYAAWNEGDKRHRLFLDSMLHSSMHIIATMRSKAVYVEAEKNGRKTIEKQGAAPEQRDGIEYEFTVVFDVSVDGNLAVRSKDRTRMFGDPFQITENTGRQLLDWLESGVDADAMAMESALAEINAQETAAALRAMWASWGAVWKQLPAYEQIKAAVAAKGRALEEREATASEAEESANG